MTVKPEVRSSGWQRFIRGCLSTLGALAFPFSRWFGRDLDALMTADRLAKGYTIILPGIEGRSSLNFSIARGLLDAGVESGIEIFDWTTGHILLFLLHLRGLKRNEALAGTIADKIVDYQDRYPGRPVYLIGHSGGGGLALLTLQQLPDDRSISGVILLAVAASPQFDVQSVLSKTQRGIWNFYSPVDAFYLVLGTLLCGTVDGKHAIAAGAVGFAEDAAGNPRTEMDHGVVGSEPASGQLVQIPFRIAMLRQFNFGGHFGWTNRVFVAEQLAPLIANNGVASSH